MNTLDKSLQKDVAALLGWGMQQYSQFVYDCGLAYLTFLAPNYPQVVAQITKSTVFWNWWKAHWELRDMQFIEIIDEASCPILDPVEIYKELNDPKKLVSGIYLNGQVLQESYATMFSELTALQTKKYREAV